MASRRHKRSVSKSPLSGSFRTPKKAKKKTVVGESPAFQELINQKLEAYLPEIANYVSTQMGAQHEGAGAGGSGSNGYTYKEFAACKSKEFDGKGGAVALTRWIEKMESVMDISGCNEGQKVKYAASSLINKALNWWNTQIQARGRDAAMGMTWEDFTALMVEEFCPSNEMLKLEEELWNHTMVGTNHAVYTDRFHELARMVPHMATPVNSWGAGFGRRACYECGSTDHLRITCPKYVRPDGQPWHQLAIEGGKHKEVKGMQLMERRLP